MRKWGAEKSKGIVGGQRTHTMVSDTLTFEGEGFDASTWLNEQLADRLATRASTGGDGEGEATTNGTSSNGSGEVGIQAALDEDILEFLGELEVKMQLRADDVGANIEEVAKRAHAELPLARAELGSLRDKTGVLRKQILQMVGTIGTTQSAVGYTMGNIQLVDRVQTNMKAARDALGEAAGMAQLLATVEQTFKQGDLTTIGRQLKQIREGLESVSGVPEFAGVETKLHDFEERLQQMVQAPLQKAFEDHDAQSVRHLSSILVLSNKSDIISSLFVSAKMFKLQSSWESFSPAQGKAFEDWLTDWLRSVLSTVEAEHTWCLEILPAQADKLFATIIETCFIGIKQSFKNRLQGTLSAAKSAFDGGESEVSPLHALLKVKNTLADFLQSVDAVLSKSASGEAKKELMACLGLCTYGQMKDQVLLYPLLERQEITSFYNKLAATVQLPTAKLKQAATTSSASVADAIEACTRAIHEMIGPSCKIGESSVQRCLSVTDGFKIDELLTVTDECLAAFLNKIGLSLRAIQDCVKSTSERKAPSAEEASYESQQEGLPEDILVSILRVLQMAALFASSVSILDENLRSSVASLRSEWADGKSSGVHVWFTLFPGQKEEHESKLSALETGEGSSVLPYADKSMKAFALSAEDLVLDFMMIKVRQSLLGLGESKLWFRAEAKDKTFDLPSFSAFPSKHVTSLGEYLLVVPQHFEVLDDLEELNARRTGAKEEGEGEGEEGEAQDTQSFAAEWISKIVEEASKLYTRDILRIPKLSPSGCAQLQADIDYLCNILQALFVSVPASLATISANLSLSVEEMRLPTNRPADCDIYAWDKISKMRRESQGGDSS